LPGPANLATLHEQTEAAGRASLGDHLGACHARRCIDEPRADFSGRGQLPCEPRLFQLGRNLDTAERTLEVVLFEAERINVVG
jgi:hypothetical protein